MRHWIGGLIATMPAAHSFLTPTINSYRRMVGFAAAPLVVSWAEENKSTALRVISRSRGPRARRAPCRGRRPQPVSRRSPRSSPAGSSASNRGSSRRIRSRILAWGLPDTYPLLPNSITAAADALEADKALADVVGDAMRPLGEDAAVGVADVPHDRR